MFNANDAKQLSFEVNKSVIDSAINKIEEGIKEIAGNGYVSAEFEIDYLIPNACKYQYYEFSGYSNNNLDILRSIVCILECCEYKADFEKETFTVSWL